MSLNKSLTSASNKQRAPSSDTHPLANVKFYLCDPKQSLCDALTAEFSEFRNILFFEIGIDMFSQWATAMVSPANSYGYMDGGVDLIIQEKLGYDVEMQLQNKLVAMSQHKIEIGDLVLLDIENKNVDWKYLMLAPTMMLPSRLPKNYRNFYLAFCAVLRRILMHNKNCSSCPEQQAITSVVVPGMGTGIGEMDPKVSARQMREAFDTIWDEEGHPEEKSSEKKTCLDDEDDNLVVARNTNKQNRK
jgi:O-acetyl-ADP-ribose deacetylase (regulator of RNase III)